MIRLLSLSIILQGIHHHIASVVSLRNQFNKLMNQGMQLVAGGVWEDGTEPTRPTSLDVALTYAENPYTS